MNALVTGASGLLGYALVEQLKARGETVRAFCRRADADLESLGAEIAYGDVRDTAAVQRACQGVDVVFHVAGVSGIWGPWQHYFATNTLGTLNVIDACRENRVSRLVYTSSPSVTFDGSAQEGVDESAPYARRWLAHYPHSKALAEQAVLKANDQRLSTCALRPHLIWGERDRQLIPRLIARARSGRLRRVGNGLNLIDTVHVDNAATAHILAADRLEPTSAVAGRVYFISQGGPVNCWKWIDELLALAGLPPVDKAIPTGAAWALGGALEAVYGALGLKGEPPMTRFLAAQLGKSHYFNIARARLDLNYEPHVSMAVGLRRLGHSLASYQTVLRP